MTYQAVSITRIPSWYRKTDWQYTGATMAPSGLTSVMGWKRTVRHLPKGTSGGDSRESVVNNLDERNFRKVAGSLSGIFRIEGQRIFNAKVVLLDRKSGEWLSSTMTDKDGYYCFPYLDLDADHYVVVGIDPAGVERAEAYDRVVPL